jgi:predicted Zn finger-like uncharacterized protein
MAIMAELKVQCPECQASLKLKDSSKLGKKIACPKCKHVFVAKSSAEDDDFLSDLPPDDDSGADEDDEELPRSRRGSSAKSAKTSKQAPAKGKKKAKQSDGPNVALLAGVGVLVLLVLGGVGLWASGLLGGKANDAPVVANQAPPMPQPAAAPPAPAANAHRLDLTWLPPDAELFVRLRPAKLLSSAIAADLGGAESPQLAEFQKATGLSPNDVESFTLAVPKVSETLGKGMFQAMSEKPDMAIGVVRLTKPLDLATVKIMDQAPTAATHNSKTYQTFPPMPGDKEAFGLYSAAPTVVVIGNETALKQAIDRGESAAPRPELDFIDADQDLVVAILPKDAKAVLQPLKFGATMSGAPIPASIENVADNSFVGLSIGANLHQGIDLQIALALKDANAATQVRTDVENLVAAGKQSFEEIKQSMPPNLGSNVGALVSSVKLTSEGNVARFSASIPKFDMGQAMMLASLPSMAGGGMQKEEDAGPAQDVGSGVQAAPLEGVPKGLAMSAETKWSYSGGYSAGITLPGPLEVKINLSGPPAVLASEAGMLKVQSIETDPPVPLKRVKPSGYYGDRDPSRIMEAVARQNYDGKASVELELAFERPAEALKQVRKIAGSFRMRIGKGTREVVLKEVRALAEAKTPSKEVKDAGVSLKLNTFEKREWIGIMSTGDAAIQEIEILDGAGKSIGSANIGGSDLSGNLNYTVSSGEGPVAKDLGVKITLITGLETVEIPYAFENIPIPPAPKLDPEQLTLSKWKPAANPDALPKDLTVEGKMRWNNFVRTDDKDKKLPRGVQLAIDLTGPMAERTMSYGFLKMDKITLDSGVTLKPEKSEFSLNDPSKQYVRPGKEMMSGNENPVGGIQASFSFDHPEKPSSNVILAEGSLKLMTSKETRVVQVAKIMDKVNKNFSSKDLREAGLELKLTKQGDTSLQLKVTKGKVAAINEARFLTSSGSAFPNVYSNIDEDDNSISFHFGGENEKIPKDLSLELSLNVGLQAVQVPFKFENLTIPPEPKPEKE